MRVNALLCRHHVLRNHEPAAYCYKSRVNFVSETFFAYSPAADMAPKVVVISGCSSGIGLSTALHLAKDAEKRFKVYATMRNLSKKGQLEDEGEKYLGNTLIVKQMDVSSDESVKEAVKEILETEGKIDVLCK